MTISADAVKPKLDHSTGRKKDFGQAQTAKVISRWDGGDND